TTAHVPDLLRTIAGRGPDQVLLSVPGVCYRRDVIDRYHVGEPHQHDLWLIRRSGPRLDQTDLGAMVAIVAAAVLPWCSPSTPESTHPYTTNGLEIYVDQVEIGECGLAHPQLLCDGGLGENASGLAMGLGLDRLVMLIKRIADIRLLRTADPRIA